MTLTIVGWCTAVLLGGLHFRTRQRLVLVARASHELRGPLCAARLGLGTLAGEPGRVAAIDLELARAGRALDDLTAAPSGARPREHREPVDIAQLVRAYTPAWTTLAAAHGAQLRCEGDNPTWRTDGPPAPAPAATLVTADPLRIAQALANLVSNAAEHGGGVVRVRVRRARQCVQVEVADDGPGLPAPVSALARPHTGRRGHGLAIASGIAEHHGGRLSTLPASRGARVVLDLPAAT